MDVNASSELVWEFYEETLTKLKGYGCKILRLDAFAYLHKEVGQTNFFNKPGTWDYLQRVREIATKNELIVLPCSSSICKMFYSFHLISFLLIPW